MCVLCPDEALRAQQGVEENPTSISVEKIVEEWRAQSTRGRYEAAMLKAAGLREPEYGL